MVYGPSWASPGMRCVCVKSDDWGYAGFSDTRDTVPVRVPMLNEVLTIREVSLSKEGAVMLTFWEIDKRQICGSISAEIEWGVHCFRPLDEPETDISIFENLLLSKKVSV